MATSRRIALLLIVSTILVYLPCLRGSFLWDDDAYISQNETLTSAHGLYDIWFKPGSVQQYYPVTFTVFWIEHRLWGLNPVGYHIVNVFLHGLNAILVGFILEGLGLSGAWAAAWLFALHPVMVESVAWMTELKNVLSTFFYLLTILMLLSSSPAATGKGSMDPRQGHSGMTARFLAIFLFVCALLSKSMTATLPASFFLIFWWMSGKFEKRKALEMLPLLTLGLGAAAFTTYYEHHLVRAEGNVWMFSMPERIMIAGRAFWFYLAKLFCPSSLSFIYPRWPAPSHSYYLLAYPIAALGFLGLLAYGRRWWGKLPFACLLFFTISLSPAMGLTSFYFMRYSFVADHFQYLAAIGPIALAGWVIARGFEKLGISLKAPAGIFVLFLLCGNLALAANRECRKYVDSFHLWQHTLALNPNSAIAHHNMGIALSERGRWNEAIAHLRTAEALDPSFPQTHLALAFFAAHANRWEDARHEYEEAIRLGIRDPVVLKDFAALRAKGDPQNSR